MANATEIGCKRCWQSLEETRRTGSLTLNEGLHLLLQSESDWRQASRTKRLIHNARFRYQASVNEIYFDTAKGRDKDRLMKFATCEYVRKGQSVTSWYDVQEKNATIADAIFDRLAKTAHRIELSVESYRK